MAEQFVEIGFYSLPVVVLTTFFSGAVIALQTYEGFSQFSAESSVALVVLIAVLRELAPVMAGLMVAGRIGAAMAAEIGTMRVAEKIDAMVTLSTNPFKYLVAPRVVASAVNLPRLRGTRLTNGRTWNTGISRRAILGGSPTRCDQRGFPHQDARCP